MKIQKSSILLLLVCALVSSLSTWLTIKYNKNQPAGLFSDSKITHEVNHSPSGSLNQALATLAYQGSIEKGTFVYAANRCTPAVVFIESSSDEADNIFALPNIGLASGSGVLISPDGYIVTNNHVVENSDKIQVTLNDNREYQASLIGTDPTTDVALIKIEDLNLPYVDFGNSDSSMVGEWVLAIGNPLRLQSTVTAGIISAKARNINILNNQQFRIESFIQTDAVVNPGNSGGALVNIQGQLIGINTAIMSQTGRYEGYSFSIPANLVKKVIIDLKDYGTVQRGLLGVVIDEVNNERAKIYGLPSVMGVFISNTTKDGAADLAGLRPEDIILEVDGRTVKSVPELQEIIGRHRPGAKIKIKFWRNGSAILADAILKNQVNTTALISTRRDPILLDLGFEVRDLTKEEKNQLSRNGVKVLSIYRGSTIEKTNMAPNYIITSVNGQKISNVDDLIKRIKESDEEVLFDGFYEKYRGRYPYRFNKN